MVVLGNLYLGFRMVWLREEISKRSIYPPSWKQKLIIQKGGTTKDCKDKNTLSIRCAFILCQKHPHGHGTTMLARSRLSFSTELIT